MTMISASDARTSLPAILDRVAAGEEVTITRHGQVVAVVVRPDVLRVRRAERATAEAERLRGLIERARRTPLVDAPTVSEARADELVADVVAGRAGR